VVISKNRYEQHKAIILPEATHEWNHLCLQDFKIVDEFNHVLHKICFKLRFCEREPIEAEKIEKTLSTMLPSERIITQQHHEKNLTVYSSLIQTLKHKRIMNSQCGTQISAHWALHHCLSTCKREEKLTQGGHTDRQGQTQESQKSHVGTSQRERYFVA
jgi:hypothetical protein